MSQMEINRGATLRESVYGNICIGDKLSPLVKRPNCRGLKNESLNPPPNFFLVVLNVKRTDWVVTIDRTSNGALGSLIGAEGV